MTNFTMATLKTPNGPKAAVGLNKQYYVLSETQPMLRDVTVLQLLQQWDISFPTLEALADEIADGKIKHAREVNEHDADLHAGHVSQQADGDWS
jgi:hypothetical protein